MSNFGRLRTICTASLFVSAGFFQSCVLRSDAPEDQGGSTSGGNDSAGNTAGGATSGAGAAGVSGNIGGLGGSVAGIAGSIAGAGESAGIAGSIAGAGGSMAGIAGSIAAASGSVAGIAGSIAGAGGSVAGIAGSIGGVSGWSNDAGSTSAGGSGLAGNGGSNMAGSDASGGGAGAASGGVGGASSGGASGNGAAGACSGADPSCAGMPGNGGASGSGGSGGSGGDQYIPLLLSTNLINFSATVCGTAPTSQTFTLTNPSSVTKTWHSVPVGAFAFLAEPTGSSLAPGEVVTVTVTPPFIPLRSRPNGSDSFMTAGLVIVDGGNYQSLTLSGQIAGAFYSWTPANLKFFAPLNTSATVNLTQSGDSSGRAAGNNLAFVATYSPLSWHEWTFTFNATTVGTQTATFTWLSIYGRPPCTPDTFTAFAVVPTPAQ